MKKKSNQTQIKKELEILQMDIKIVFIKNDNKVDKTDLNKYTINNNNNKREI